MAQEGDLKINIDSSSAVVAKKNLADLVAIGERAQKAIAATENASKKMAKGFDDGQKAVASASRSIDKYVQSLQMTAATNGKSARETKLFELAVQGASKAQLQAADAAIRMNEGYERGIALGQRLRVGFIALGAAAGAATIATVASSIKLLDSLDDMSEKTGLSVERLSELRYAGEVSGTAFDALGNGISRLSKLMAQAAGGNKEASATFRALGIDVVNTDGTLRSSESVLSDLANRFSGYEDGAGKAALAQRVFGKSGEDMLPFLNRGANGIERLRKEAQQLGAVYGGDVAKAAADFSDNTTKVRLASEGAAISISGGLIKSLANLSTQYLETAKAGGFWAAQTQNYSSFVKSFWNGTLFSGEAAAKSTEQIQAYVNAMGGAAANGGRGFRNPAVAAPVVQEEGRKSPRTPKDNSAEQEARARLSAELDRIKNQYGSITDTIANGEKILEATRSAALIDETAYYASKRALMAASSSAQQEGIAKEIERLQAEKSTGKDAINNQRAIENAQARLNKLRADGATALEVLAKQEEGAAKRIEDALLNAQEAAESYLDTISRGYQREIAGVGQGDKFRERQGERGAIDDSRQEREQQLRGELRRKEIDEDSFKQYLAGVNDTYNKEVALYERRTTLLDEMQKNWLTGATEALHNYADEAANVAKQTEETVSNALSGLEDQLVNLFTGKKFDAKKLFEDLQADVARSFVKENITGPLASAAGDALGLAGLFGGGKGTDRGANASNPLYVRSADPLSSITGGSGKSGGGLLGELFSGASSLFGGFSNSTATTMANLSGGGLDDLLKYTNLFSGFASGGFTGPGAKYQPAGIVHAGEYVVNAENTRRLGLGFLERLNKRGYVDGGYVGAMAASRSGDSGGGDRSGRPFAPTINVQVDGQVDRRTRDQIAADMSRALARAQRLM
jgi:lambda family phage tail tape measure protein